MSKIDKPIFIVGSGRSGTTVFFRVLAKHHNLASFSNYDVKFPRLLDANILPIIYKDKSLTHKLAEAIQPIKPAQETIHVMGYCGINALGLPLSEGDYDEEMDKRLKRLIGKCLNYHKTGRFIAKNVQDSMRIQFLNRLFPDAIFLHVIRDPLASVYSKLSIPFFKTIGFWWWENKTYKDWLNEGRDPVELAALHWKNTVAEIERQSATLPKERYLVVRYEDLTNDPTNCFKRILDSCELEWNSRFAALINETGFNNTNYKWQQALTEKDVALIDKTVSETAKRYHYDCIDQYQTMHP